MEQDLAQSVSQAMERLLAAGGVEVRENGERVAGLDGFRYELRSQRGSVLLHLWSKERILVRRIRCILSEEHGRLALETARFGRTRPDRLEFISGDGPRPAAKIAREDFQIHIRELFAQQFPDETLTSLTVKPDLEHSFSGNYARGALESCSQAWAVLVAAPGEAAATYNGLLTFGLLWLDRIRQSARRKTIAGLRLFFPAGVGSATAHRLQGISPSTVVQLHEYDLDSRRSRLMDPGNFGNVDSWLAPRREAEVMLEEARPVVERIRRLIAGKDVAPGVIEAEPIAGAHEVALRFHGLLFGRWSRDGMFYGLGDARRPLTPDRQPDFARLVRDLQTYRSPLSTQTRHPLYRAQPERWFEATVLADPGRIDARLDPRFLYPRVPAVSASDRGVMDIVGATRAGRLAVLELKVSEDPHLVLQAVDYWLRVRWHHERQDFLRYAYFPGITLDPRPPLLFLVAPAIRFHSATDALLRHIKQEIEVCRVGVSEHWRRGLKVVLRQTCGEPALR